MRMAVGITLEGDSVGEDVDGPKRLEALGEALIRALEKILLDLRHEAAR